MREREKPLYVLKTVESNIYSRTYGTVKKHKHKDTHTKKKRERRKRVN